MKATNNHTPHAKLDLHWREVGQIGQIAKTSQTSQLGESYCLRPVRLNVPRGTFTEEVQVSATGGKYVCASVEPGCPEIHRLQLRAA